jgi:hypothetical protein
MMEAAQRLLVPGEEIWLEGGATDEEVNTSGLRDNAEGQLRLL